MKIAYIFLNSLENKTADVLQSLSFSSEFSRKNELIFFASYFNGRKVDENFKFFCIKKNFKIIRTIFPVQFKNFLWEKVGRFFSCFAVFLYLKFNKFDLIYTRDFSFIYFYSFLPRFLKLKNKIFFEAHKIYSLTSNKVDRHSEFRAYKSVDYFISTSENCKQDLISIFGVDSQKIKVFPNATDISFFKNKNNNHKKEFKDFFKDKGEKIFLVYSGSFLKWKGVDILISSLKYLSSSVRVFLFGGDINDLKPRKKEIDFYIKNKSLFLAGGLNRKDLRTILQNSDIGVLSNNFNKNNKYTSPMKIPEYMSSGLAIIAPEILNSCDFLKDGSGVLFFKTSDPLDLAEKINFLVQNKKELFKLSQENIKKSAMFDLELRVCNIVSFFVKKIKNDY